MTITPADAELALWVQQRAMWNRLHGFVEAADQLDAFARSILHLPRRADAEPTPPAYFVGPPSIKVLA